MRGIHLLEQLSGRIKKRPPNDPVVGRMRRQRWPPPAVFLRYSRTATRRRGELAERERNRSLLFPPWELRSGPPLLGEAALRALLVLASAVSPVL
ncbi:hypothetical protein HPB47_004144 [Ixodes persulcatus]|uniref:Uncharacterized protein n=1 Tax=Ixodes persulcatus TaxID=34615 RepID=A0AC60PHA9_IXOPE|nr:hypothetical protein HPB47_004144 [Ixodes persulcatus]